MLSNLKKFRLLANLSQQEVANKVGVSQPTYQRWESGSSQVPPSKLNKLAKMLHVTVAEFQGAPPPFDYLGYDQNLKADRRYFGEVAFHFISGSSLLLPITIAQRDCLSRQVAEGGNFLIVASLDNRTVAVQLNAVSDIFFSSEAYDDFGPEHGDYEHGPGIYPDDDFWSIVEFIEAPELLDDSLQKRVKEVEETVELTDKDLDELILNGSIPELDRASVRARADVLKDQFQNFAAYTSWQISNNKIRAVYIEKDHDIYSLISHVRIIDAESQGMLYIAAEGYHRTIFVNPASINYLTCPTHRLNRGMMHEREELIDQVA